MAITLRNGFFSNINVALLVGTSFFAFTVSAESIYDPLPVEQREAIDTHYPTAIDYSTTQPDSTASQSSQVASPVVSVNPPPVPSNEQWELYNQIQQMQEELQVLRGILEQQTHELEQMKRQQRERYLDLDHRLGQLKAPTSVPVVSAPDVAVSDKPLGMEAQQEKDTLQYNAAYQLLKERKFPEAIDAFQSLLASSPGGVKAPYCEYWLGELFLASDPADLDKAKTHFVTLLTQYPGHGKVPDGMYKLGTVFNKAGDKAKARVTLKRVIKDYRGSQAAKLAETYLSTL